MNNNPSNRPARDRICAKPQSPKASAPSRFDSSDKKFFAVVAISSLVMILLITFMLCFAIKRATGHKEEPGKTDNKPPSIPSSSSATLGETEDMGQAYIDSMIFFGDSNTAHLRSYGMLSGGKKTLQVWSTKSQTVTLDSEITNVKIEYPGTADKYVEMTIIEAVTLKKPKYIVLSLGTNGVSTLTESQFKYCYKKLITAIKQASPDTKIIIQTIYPVTASYTGFSNEKINTANGWILDIAEELGVRVADTASVLKDENGAMKESFNSDHHDGYHVNDDAYEKILHYLRTHGYQ